MKSLIISLCFILLFASTNPLDAAAVKVVDVDGNPLEPGVEYYARYSTWPSGQLNLASIGNNVCPLSVIESGSIESDGIPITIQPKEGGTDILEKSNVFIEFKGANTSLCPKDSTIWRVSLDISINKAVITVGGSHNWLSEFQIETSGTFAYKFLARPFPLITRFISRDPMPVGGGFRLALDDGSTKAVPYLVVFFKKSNLDGIRLPK